MRDRGYNKLMRMWFVLVALPATSAAACTAEDAEPFVAWPTDTHLTVEASQGTYTLPFSVNITGTGTTFVGSVDLAGGAVDVDGAVLDVATYLSQYWPAFGVTSYQAIAVGPDRWYVLWFYCDGSDLIAIFSEGTDGRAPDFEAATGTCSTSTSPSTVSAAFPAIDMAVPAAIDGFTVTGAELSLTGHADWARLGRVTNDVFVWSVVDCTMGCSTGGSWYELHALLWDRDLHRLCFGIFYLETQRPTTVTLAYTFSLPDLRDPLGTRTFTAAWSRP